MKQLAPSVSCSGITVAEASSSRGSLTSVTVLQYIQFLNHMQNRSLSVLAEPCKATDFEKLLFPPAAKLNNLDLPGPTVVLFIVFLVSVHCCMCFQACGELVGAQGFVWMAASQDAAAAFAVAVVKEQSSVPVCLCGKGCLGCVGDILQISNNSPLGHVCCPVTLPGVLRELLRSSGLVSPLLCVCSEKSLVRE